MGFPCWQLTAWGLPRSFFLPHFTGRQSAELRVTDCAPDSNLRVGTPSQLNPSNMYEPRSHQCKDLEACTGFGIRKLWQPTKMHHFELIYKNLDRERVHLIERCNYQVLKATGLINFWDMLLTELSSFSFFTPYQGWIHVSERLGETRSLSFCLFYFPNLIGKIIFSPTVTPGGVGLPMSYDRRAPIGTLVWFYLGLDSDDSQSVW